MLFSPRCIKRTRYIESMLLLCCHTVRIKPLLVQHLVFTTTIPSPANTRQSANAGLMVGQRLRRWPTIKPALGECFVFPALRNNTTMLTTEIFHEANLIFNSSVSIILWSNTLLYIKKSRVRDRVSGEGGGGFSKKPTHMCISIVDVLCHVYFCVIWFIYTPWHINVLVTHVSPSHDWCHIFYAEKLSLSSIYDYTYVVIWPVNII